MKRISALFTSILMLIFMVSMSHAFGNSQMSTGRSAAQGMSSISGKIAETMDSGGYTYLNIENNGTKTWVAVPAMQVTVGQEISVARGVPMTNFTSKSLDRTFDTIFFSTGPVNGQAAASTETPAGTGKEKEEPASAIKVDKASGPDAYTVAELYEKSGSLDKNSITLKGQVVKVSASIMGKNWIHIEDGSGDAASGNNKIIVTSQDLPSVGDVVTAKGTLYKDKDFGSGYKYAVIVEEGTISK